MKAKPQHPPIPQIPGHPSSPKTTHQPTPATSAAASHKKALPLTAAAKEQQHQSAAASPAAFRQGRRARITNLNHSKQTHKEVKKGDRPWA